MKKISVKYVLLTVCDEIDRINRDIYSLLNLVLLPLVLVGWHCDIVLARMLLAADRWLFIAAAIITVIVVIVVLLLVRPFLLLNIGIIPLIFNESGVEPRPRLYPVHGRDTASGVVRQQPDGRGYVEGRRRVRR